MTNLTDFTNADDVSDAAIEWVLQQTGGNFKVEQIRQWAGGNNPPDRARIIAARLIQQHRPDLLVDPVDEIVLDIVAKEYEGNGDYATAARVRMGQCRMAVAAAKRAYLMGKEAGK